MKTVKLKWFVLFFLIITINSRLFSQAEISTFKNVTLDSLVLKSKKSGREIIIESGSLLKVWVDGKHAKGRLKSVDNTKLTIHTSKGNITFDLTKINKIKVLYKGIWRGVSILIYAAGAAVLVAYAVVLVMLFPEFTGAVVALLLHGIVVEGFLVYGIGSMFRGRKYYMKEWKIAS